MRRKNLELNCPYCGNDIEVVPPSQDQDLVDLECVPYTRDIGRFDPDSREDWMDPDGWRAVGKDYFSWMSFETIGILRIRRPGVRVWYRVQGCPRCGELFDAYANYTENTPLGELWPHLFAPDPARKKDIKPYLGESWLVWAIFRIHGWMRSITFSGILLGLGIFFSLFLPWLIPNPARPELGSLSFLLDVSTRSVAAVGLIVILIISAKYVEYIRDSSPFKALFKIRRDRSVVHWQNYTLSRFVGVQGPGAFPSLSQVDILAGGSALGLFFLAGAWVSNQWLGLFYGVFGLLFAIGTAILLFWLAQRNRNFLRIAEVVIITSLVGLSYWFWSGTPPGEHWHLLRRFTDVVFWGICAYVFGTAAWLSMNTANYVFDGLRKIPTRLTPYNNFLQAQPLRKLQAYAIWSTLALFITIIGIITLLTVAQNLQMSGSFAGGSDLSTNDLLLVDWLISWLQWALVAIFGAISLGAAKNRFVGILLIYVLLEIIFTPFTFNLASLIRVDFVIFGKVLPIGVFYTLLMIDQILTTDSSISEILQRAKDRVLADLRRESLKYHRRLNDLHEGSNKKTVSRELEEERLVILQSIESVLEITNKVEAVPVRPMTRTRFFQSIPPLITSIVLPALVDNLLSQYVDTLL